MQLRWFVADLLLRLPGVVCVCAGGLVVLFGLLILVLTCWFGLIGLRGFFDFVLVVMLVGFGLNA